MDQTTQEINDILMHYGTPRHSGRYPWGSGDNPYQHSGDFLARVDEYKQRGMSDNDIAKEFGLTTTQYRTQKALAQDERRSLLVDRARSLKEDGLNNSEIAKVMGFNSESSVRSLLNSDAEARTRLARATADNLKKQVDQYGMIEIGKGAETYLGVSREKLNEALYILELEGYNHFGGGIPEVTNAGKQINMQVLCPPGTPFKEKEVTYTDANGEEHTKTIKVSPAIYDYENVHMLQEVANDISYDDGDTFTKAFHYPASMDSSRLQVVYGDQGGAKKDGVMEIRRNVDDLSLGDAHYAQVRILVDGTHYIKGMAMYADDLPDGIDIRFNTNKPEGTPILGPKENSVLKPISKDPDNPFGSLIKEHGGQSFYDDPNGSFIDPITGKKQSLSLINKRAEEADWSDWDDKIPSQFLGKQSMKLINSQLDLTLKDKQAELKEINEYTNNIVKRAMLNEFAGDCDAAAVHLKAAALPRQKYKVILPIESMKDNEVYAPGYENGEQVALIRFPHAGTFEIPILTVNNKQKEAKSKLELAKDAIGINHKVAQQLSGADFDGDTVMVIPTGKNGVKITATPKIKSLENFDAKLEYGHDSVVYDSEGKVKCYKRGETTFKPMRNTQLEMGKVSNLITDMTLRGATEAELVKAVKHSMVVIDAEKHGLDYKKSERDNDIAYLRKTYQSRVDDDGNERYGGSSTLLSRAKSPVQVLKRKGSPKINEKGKDWYDPDKPEGALIYKEVVETYTDKKGKTKTRTQGSYRMAETPNAYDLVSDVNTKQERAYAKYANACKSLANQARLTAQHLAKTPYDASAKRTYKTEVDGLMADLTNAKKNAPREKQAQLYANTVINAKKRAYKESYNDKIPKKELKKISQQALSAGRQKYGAKRTTIKMTDKRWQAIQSGAISENVLSQILRYSDMDEIRQYAMPRSRKNLSEAKVNKIKAMESSGNYSIAQIAQAVGVSSSTVSNYLGDDKG